MISFRQKKVHRPHTSKATGYALVCWTLCIYCGWQRFPELFAHSEMWAEAGTNYFCHAATQRWLEAIQALDVGYIPLLPRLLAQLFHHTADSIARVPVLYQNTALVGSSFFISLFCWPRYRMLVKCDSIRFLICLGLSTNVDYELQTFINFSYYGCIAFLLTLMELPFQKKTTVPYQIVVSLGLSILALSKAAFLAFLPATCLLFLWALRKKHKPIITILVCVLASFCLQAVTMSRSVGQSTTRLTAMAQLLPATGENLLSILKIALNQDYLDAPLATGWRFYVAFAGSTLGAFLFVRSLWKCPLQAYYWLLTLTASVAFFALLLVRLAFPTFPPLATISFASVSIRFWFFATLVIYFALACGVSHGLVGIHQTWQHILFCFWLCTTYPFGLHPNEGEPTWPTRGFSDWQHFGTAAYGAKPPHGCIPMDPYGFIQAHYCKVALPLPTAHTVSQPAVIPLHYHYRVAPAIKTQCISTVGFVVANSSMLASWLTASNVHAETFTSLPGHLSPGGHVLWFDFKPCLLDIQTLQITGPATHQLGIVESGNADGLPAWIWFAESNIPGQCGAYILP